MYLALVGCSIFRNEIEFLDTRIKNSIEYYWLAQRLHNKPLELRKMVQNEIDAIDKSGKKYDAVILLYGLCSKGVAGIYSKNYRLVIPKVQDCISILLGSRKRYAEHFKEKPGTYWFTKGWIETGFDPGKRTKYNGVFDPYKEKYKQYRKKFDEEVSRYLINEWDQHWIQNYTTLAFIDWDMKDSQRFRKKAVQSAKSLGLEFEPLEGNPRILLDLLNGNWKKDDFLVVPPGMKIMPSYTDDILTCSSEEAEAAAVSDDSGHREAGAHERKGLGLGIDAGGTYTDTVLYDFSENRVVAWAKALTTHDDYTRGIEASLDKLAAEIPEELFSTVGLVSLSTTLATNAIVEGKGGRAGIILIGYDRYTLKGISLEPAVVVRGKHSIEGESVEPLDLNEAKAAIRELISHGIDAFAVSSEVGARNPEYELKVKELIQQTTDLPVVCGSELTDELNCVKRANTCYFNARLIPLVTHLLTSVKDVLSKKGVAAPVMVVKGDGTLMGENAAKTRPVEMVLSGPAASVIGGAYLAGLKDGYVVDMGGTTTDAAIVENGFVAFKNEGISIEGFRTAVKTVDIHTFGLGGDSYITYNYRDKSIHVGPRRVVPLCYLADQFPQVLSQLSEKSSDARGEEILVQPVDYFMFQKDIRGHDFHPQEEAIVSILKKNGPMPREQLVRKVKASGLSLLRTERLEMFGYIFRSALTPTDVLHAADKISFWNKEAAKRAVELYAVRAGCSAREFMDRVLREFYRNLIYQLLSFIFREDKSIHDRDGLSHNISHHLFSTKKQFHIDVRLKKPIVFIGAPSPSYAENLKEYIDLKVHVPEYNAVANAIGAITGAVREVVTILIRPEEGRGFTAFAPDRKINYKTLKDAKHAMSGLASDLVRERARLSGARNVDVKLKVEDKKVKLSRDDEVYLETVITASVSSVPAMKR